MANVAKIAFLLLIPSYRGTFIISPKLNSSLYKVVSFVVLVQVCGFVSSLAKWFDADAEVRDNGGGGFQMQANDAL